MASSADPYLKTLMDHPEEATRNHHRPATVQTLFAPFNATTVVSIAGILFLCRYIANRPRKYDFPEQFAAVRRPWYAIHHCIRVTSNGLDNGTAGYKEVAWTILIHILDLLKALCLLGFTMMLQAMTYAFGNSSDPTTQGTNSRVAGVADTDRATQEQIACHPTLDAQEESDVDENPTNDVFVEIIQTGVDIVHMTAKDASVPNPNVNVSVEEPSNDAVAQERPDLPGFEANTTQNDFEDTKMAVAGDEGDDNQEVVEYGMEGPPMEDGQQDRDIERVIDRYSRMGMTDAEYSKTGIMDVEEARNQSFSTASTTTAVGEDESVGYKDSSDDGTEIADPSSISSIAINEIILGDAESGEKDCNDSNIKMTDVLSTRGSSAENATFYHDDSDNGATDKLIY